MGWLLQTKAFQAESTSSSAKLAAEAPEKANEPVPITRYITGELFKPSDAIRALGLPILAWNTQIRWKANSTEGNVLLEV